MTLKNIAAFEALQKSLNAMTHDGRELTPIIFVSRGNEFRMHTITKNGKVIARLVDPNLAIIFGPGIWVLMEHDLWILINELAEVLKDEIQFMDRKKNGWVQVLVPINNRMLNLRLSSFRSSRQLWWKSLFDSKLKSIRGRMVSLS